jgi:hypothetical protein
MENGAPIEFVSNGPLGVMDDPNSSRFAAAACENGMIGQYVGPHPNPELRDQDWHLTIVRIEGRDYYCPVHAGHFKPLEDH